MSETASAVLISDYLIDVIGDRDFSINMIQNQEQRQSRQSHLEYSRNYLRRNTEKKRQERESMQLQIRREEP